MASKLLWGGLTLVQAQLLLNINVSIGIAGLIVMIIGAVAHVLESR